MKVKFQKEFIDFCQDFNPLIPDWQPDPVDGHPVLVGDVNEHELVQSSASCGLDFVMDRFLETGAVPVQESSGPYTDKFVNGDKLDKATAYKNQFNALCDKYHLPYDINPDDLIKALENYKSNIKIKENVDEKTTQQKSEQKSVQENSQQN